MNKKTRLLRTFQTAAAMALLTVLFAAFLTAVPVFADDEISYNNGETGYVAAIQDNADLLDDSEEADLLEKMMQMTEYCNAFFITSQISHSQSTDSYAEDLNNSTAKAYGADPSDSAVFLIDMNSREIYIYSGKNVYKSIRKADAETITDNTYIYASWGNYYLCASEAFEQMYKVIDGQKIARPMKFITAALLAAFVGLFAGYVVLKIKTKNRYGSSSGWNYGKKNKPTVRIHNAKQVKILKKPHREAGSSGGSGFSSSSSGGSSGGGGGGHSF